MNYKWELKPESLNKLILDVNISFVGFITDNMLSAFIGQEKDKSNLNLILLYKEHPSKLDAFLVKNEIIHSLEDDLFKYGIRKINLINLQGEEGYKTLNKYEDYIPIFKKYLENIDDSIEAEGPRSR